MLLRVVGPGVDSPPVLPLVDEPREIGALAFAADRHRRTRLAVSRIVGTRNGVAFGARGDGDIERVGHHLLRAARFAAAVVLHVAVVEVQQQDAVGERLQRHQIGCGRGPGRRQEDQQQGRQPRRPPARKAMDWLHQRQATRVPTTTGGLAPRGPPARPGHRPRKGRR